MAPLILSLCPMCDSIITDTIRPHVNLSHCLVTDPPSGFLSLLLLTSIPLSSPTNQTIPPPNMQVMYIYIYVAKTSIHPKSSKCSPGV